MMHGAIEKVRDDPDVRGHRELPAGIGSETFRDRGHPIRLVDAECDCFRIRPIAAKQRDVGAVQRRDDRGYGRISGRGENLTGQVRRRGVRNRVMYMQQIDIVIYNSCGGIRT